MSQQSRAEDSISIGPNARAKPGGIAIGNAYAPPGMVVIGGPVNITMSTVILGCDCGKSIHQVGNEWVHLDGTKRC